MAKFIIEIRSKGFSNVKKRIDETTIALRKQTKQTTLLSRANTRLRQTTDGITRVFGAFRNKLLLVAFATGLVAGALRKLRDATPSSELQDLTRGFDNLRIANGLNAETLNKLEEATNNTVDRMELMRQANNAMLLGVARSTDELASMFDSAQRLARALGKDATFGIESFVTGLGRQSRLMLDNIGIVVDTDAAYQKYADQLGVTVSELTDAERKTAFLNEGLTQAGLKAETAGKEVITVSDRLRASNKSFLELSQTISRFLEPATLSLSEGFAKLADKISAAISEADQFAKMQNFQTRITNLKNELEALKNAEDGSIDSTRKLTKEQQQEQEQRKKRVAQLAAEILGRKELDRFETELVASKLGLRDAISAEEAALLKLLVQKDKQAAISQKIIELEQLSAEIQENIAERSDQIEQEDIARHKANMERNLSEMQALQEMKALQLAQEREQQIAHEDEMNRIHSIAAKELAELEAEENATSLATTKKTQQELEQQFRSTASAITSVAGAFQILANKGASAEDKMKSLLTTIGALLMQGGGAGLPFGAALQAFSGFIGHTGGLIQNNGIQRFATGGMVQGQDNVPILAQSGEFIMQRSAVNSIGLQNLAQMNNTGEPSGGMTINISGDMIGDEDHVRTKVLPAIREELRREANA